MTIFKEAAAGNRSTARGRRPCAAVALAAALALAAPAARPQSEFSDFAKVGEDGSLHMGDRIVRLYGIYIPPTDETCYAFVRPMPCGPRALLALDFRIAGDFVHCTPRAVNPDGSTTASCSVGRDDLSEWMLQRGWAVALPDAPFQYAAMEKIAQARGIGIWGIPVDAVRNRHGPHR